MLIGSVPGKEHRRWRQRADGRRLSYEPRPPPHRGPLGCPLSCTKLHWVLRVLFLCGARRCGPGRPATLLQPYVRRAMDDAAPTCSFATRAVQDAGKRVLDSRSREAAATQLSLSGTDSVPRPSVRSASKIFASRLLCTLLQAARLQPRRNTLPLRIARPSTPALSFLRPAAPIQHAYSTNLPRS